MMEFLTVIGFILSAISVLMAILALYQSDDAKKAVAKVINRGSDQEARDKSRALMKTLQDARDAAIARRSGASRVASAGRSPPADLHMLELAQDALATTTLITDTAVIADLRAAAVELEKARKNIGPDAERDGWSDALATLQVVLPKIEEFERTLAKKELQIA